MSPAWVRPRDVEVSKKHPRGRSFQVLYRRGGRGFRVETAGTFATEKEARARRDLVAGWLAAGLDPKLELARLAAPTIRPRSYEQAAEALIRSRHDASESTIDMKRKAIAKLRELRPDLLQQTAEQWTVSDVLEFVAAMVEANLSPATIEKYLGEVKLVLDFAEVDPNPARDKRVRTPSNVRAEVEPPSADEFVSLLDKIAVQHRLPLIVLEQTAMRVGELVSLPWGDVDVAGCRFRLSRERTKTRHPRWVQVPGWLMEVIAGSCPQEDRTPTRRVFQVAESTLRNVMWLGCRDAGIPTYSPHDLRHRRASLWHGQGLSTRELMERGGWSRSEVAIDVYSHVMPLTEASESLLGALAVRSR